MAMKAARKANPQLGLVCITASEALRYRAITRERLLQLDVAEQKSVLRQLYADNLSRLDAAIDYCLAHDIRLYRLTSSLFPFADDSMGEDVLEEFGEAIAAKGDEYAYRRLPRYIVIAANDSYLPGRVNFSARSGANVSVLDFLREIELSDGEGYHGHGHDQASGGSLPVERWNELLAKLGFSGEVFAVK